MLKLFNLFLDICLLRKNPQDVPASSGLLLLVILLNIITSVIGIADILPANEAFAAALLDAVVILLFLQLLLRLKGHIARFQQAATAVFGSGVILGLMALPLQLSVGDAETTSPLVSLAYLILLVWIQVVIGHIFRHALNVPLALGIGLALVYSVLSGVMIQSVFFSELS